MRSGILAFEELPATLAFDLLYCLLLEETKEGVERRQELDEHLSTYSVGAGPIDRATWGKLPAHQRAMRRAITAGGAESNVGG